MISNYKPYFDPSFPAHQEYKKEFVLKNIRKTSGKLLTSSYRSLFNERALAGVSGWLKECASKEERLQFHALFKKLAETKSNPYIASSEIDKTFFSASNYGSGILEDKAMRKIASWMKQEASSQELELFKKVMTGIKLYKNSNQPGPEYLTKYIETTPHMLDRNKYKPANEVAEEKLRLTFKRRPKSAIVNKTSTTTIKKNTSATEKCEKSNITMKYPFKRPTTAPIHGRERDFECKKPYAVAPTQTVTTTTSRIFYKSPKNSSFEGSNSPSWTPTFTATASAGGIYPPVKTLDLLSEVEEKSIKEKSPTSNKNWNYNLGTTTYKQNFVQPKTNVKTKPFHQVQYKRPFGDFGDSVNMISEYCKQYQQKDLMKFKV
ncbi:hypothetical protein ABK040_002939 [Willaertia magna]